MTDKPKNIEQWAGCGLNDPKARFAGRIPMGGYGFNLSATEGPDPAPKAKGHNVPGTRNLKNEG